jgi:transcriptional regulator with XRE-family HTH domain
MFDIGAKITMLRKQKGWSQTELAKKIDCSRATLINYEGNKNIPSIDVAAKIAKALGVTLDYLVKDGEYEQIDKETLKRLKEIQKLSSENKSHVFALLDAFIKQTKLQSIL